MVDDEDSIQLSEYCFNACEVLRTVVRGRNPDSLSESVRVALEDLERCVHRSGSACSLTKQPQGHRRDRANSEDGDEYATY